MPVLPSTPEAGKPWTPLECEAVVASYFEMLRAEVRGERYSKTDAVRSLEATLRVRSRGSTERKLQNVSAILNELARDPRIYVLDGNVAERASLEAKVFLGIPLDSASG